MIDNSNESFFSQNPAENLSDSLLGSLHEEKDLPQVPTSRSVYELVDDALDEIGEGRLQWEILAVTSSGQFIDAAEVMILALVMPELQVEWSSSEGSLALIASLTALGMMFGSTAFGKLSDSFGRKLSYQWSLVICIGFGFVSSFATNAVQFAILRMFLGIGYGGNMVACTTYLVEFAPNYKRAKYMSICSLAFGFGSVFIVILSWCTMEIIGWRWIVRIASLVAIPTFFGLFYLPESVRFHVSVQDYQKAEEGIVYLANVNRQPVPSWFNKECLVQAGESYLDTVKSKWIFPMLCGNKFILQSMIHVSLIWFLNSFASTIFTWIPLEISNYYPNVPNIKFQVACTLSIGGLCGSVLAYILTMHTPRLFVIRLSSFLCGVATLVLGAVAKSEIALFIIAFILELNWTVLISTMYLYTPEIFPTRLRVTCFGVAQLGHRLAPTLAPFAISALNDISFSATCILLGIVYLLSFMLTCFLNVETFRRRLIECDV